MFYGKLVIGPSTPELATVRTERFKNITVGSEQMAQSPKGGLCMCV